MADKNNFQKLTDIVPQTEPVATQSVPSESASSESVPQTSESVPQTEGVTTESAPTESDKPAWMLLAEMNQRHFTQGILWTIFIQHNVTNFY